MGLPEVLVDWKEALEGRQASSVEHLFGRDQPFLFRKLIRMKKRQKAGNGRFINDFCVIDYKIVR
ncbi:hypothetical protein GD3902_16180 [Geobacillus thermodenitrificans]|nr:hypothetical protein GD3902_16180 [Geobacillus thermodenitrificans]